MHRYSLQLIACIVYSYLIATACMLMYCYSCTYIKMHACTHSYLHDHELIMYSGNKLSFAGPFCFKTVLFITQYGF